ncbi:MAG: hypothetical protein LW875_11470 [Proteobacteria bacterium]|jgi:hypothetical protein|nr:hypothetical protein [Pseudomonadota bacterium]
MNEKFPGQNQVHAELLGKLEAAINPPLFLIHLKLMALHVISSAASLAVCPQFGFGYAHQGHGLMEYFMVAGPMGCQILCGSFYFLGTLLISNFVLSSFEWRKMQKHLPSMLTFLISLSLGFFWMISATLTFELVLWWTVGGVVIFAISYSIPHLPSLLRLKILSS